GPPRRDADVRGAGHRVPRRGFQAGGRGQVHRRRDREETGGRIAMGVRWEDLEEGTIGPAPLVIGPLTRTDFVRYQGASGDMNPLHHDEEFARAAGFSAPLAVGMFGAGALNAWAAG